LKETYPFYSPYQFAANSPIAKIDVDGLGDETPIVPKEVYISIVSSKEIESGTYTAQVQMMGSALVIVTTDIEKASTELSNYMKKLPDPKTQVDKITIVTHGVVYFTQDKKDSGIRGIETSPDVKGNITANNLNTDASKNDVDALKSIVGNLKKGGEVVLAGCEIGDDKVIVNKVYSLINDPSATLYTNKDVTSESPFTTTATSASTTYNTINGKKVAGSEEVTTTTTTTTGFTLTTAPENYKEGWQATKGAKTEKTATVDMKVEKTSTTVTTEKKK
jgi:hypothetical protein